MPEKGWDAFFFDPGTVDAMKCKVCNSDLLKFASMDGPTGFGEAMARHHHVHDKFVCQHTKEDWHERALRLHKEMEATASQSLQALIRNDLQKLLRTAGMLFDKGCGQRGCRPAHKKPKHLGS